MARTYEGPRRHGGQTHIGDDRHFLGYRIPPIVRITAELGATTAKRTIVARGPYGWMPIRLAENLARLGGLRHG